RSVSLLLAIMFALTAVPGIAQSVLRPTERNAPRPPSALDQAKRPGLAVRLNAPLLQAPDAQSVVLSPMRGTTPPAMTFRWAPNPTASTVAPSNYVLCLGLTAQGCQPAATTLVREIPLSEREYTLNALPLAFEGRMFYWSVGVCAQVPGNCAFATSRAVQWFVPPDAAPVPVAHPPLQYREVGNFVLSWTHAGGPAVSYRMCFARPSAPCGDSDSVIVNASTNTSHRITAEHARRYGYERFAGREMRWAVAACNPAGCTWSAAAGSLTLPPKPRATVTGRQLGEEQHYDGTDRRILERGNVWGTVEVSPDVAVTGRYPRDYALRFRLCLLYEGDPGVPHSYEARTDPTPCETPLANVLRTGYPDVSTGYASCSIVGFPRRGLYRFFGAVCDDFWGQCQWAENSLPFGIATYQYDDRDFKLGCLVR
ncbi:MAG TPA: hypothetical protein P5528_10100, partial [Steroidobacteraceae bacterium]|nr:hypothetical protein [Steroidobacteraceae bacterium]